MKLSKRINSSKQAPPSPPSEIKSLKDLRDFQRVMAEALFLPLNKQDGMQTRWHGRKMSGIVEKFVKPNDRLSSFERLEIYSRSYWFRILDCFYDDYPGLRAMMGNKPFMKLAEAYLAKYPSASFTLRNLGSRVEKFLRERPEFVGKKYGLAVDIIRFEWAQVVAFDGEAKPPLHVDELLGADPAKLHLGLQPYITVLALDYPVDDFILAVKKHEALRSEASNAKTSAPKVARQKKVPLPKHKKTFLAVHRHNNMLFYKQLTQESCTLLTAMRKGHTVEEACFRALKKADPFVDWSAQIKNWFQTWSSLGWFCKP